MQNHDAVSFLKKVQSETLVVDPEVLAYCD